jgi:hypothetical protein
LGLQTLLESRGRVGRILLVGLVLVFFGVSVCAWHEYGHMMAADRLGVSASILSSDLTHTRPDVSDWRIVPIAYAGGAVVVFCLLVLDLLIDVESLELSLRTVAVIEAVYGLCEGTWFLAWYLRVLEGHLWWTANGLSVGAALGGAIGVAVLLAQMWRLGWLKPEI